MSMENVVNYIHVKNVDSEAQTLMRFNHTLKISMDHLNKQDTDIDALPVNCKPKEQNFDGLVMDDEGSIDVEESDDEYNDKDNTEKLLTEDEYEIVGLKQQTTKKK